VFALEFSGWAQCRLPTDPDPSNEPRGVSGYTFALAGEPDLDRIIRFQPTEGIVEREAAPAVGVMVRSGWWLDSGHAGPPRRIEPDHPIVGSRVDLLGDPQFDSRNYVVVNNGFGVIWPFHLCIDNGRSGADHVKFERSAVIDPSRPDASPVELDEEQLHPFLLSAPVLHSALVLAETGIVDPVAWRLDRLARLRELRTGTDPSDIVRIAALDKRITELEHTDGINRRTQQIGTKAYCRYPLNGDDAVVDVQGVARRMSSVEPWNLEMWFGGWDADALNFFVKGAVVITDLDDDLG
jgi:hypothetical protein